jgi:hypothetical protein
VVLVGRPGLERFEADDVRPSPSASEDSSLALGLGKNEAGIRKMIARLHEELAVYEGSEEARQPASN